MEKGHPYIDRILLLNILHYIMKETGVMKQTTIILFLSPLTVPPQKLDSI